MSGILGPIITGAIIDWTGVYDNAFILTAAIAAFGGFWWLLAVPKIEQMELD